MNANDISENTMTKIKYYLSDLGDLKVNGYKIKNINFLEKVIIFSNNNSSDEYKINFEEMKNKQNNTGESFVSKDETFETKEQDFETSELNTDQKINSGDFSTTSVSQSMVEPKQTTDQLNKMTESKQIGGNNKNIFKSSKYSDTSELNTEQNKNIGNFSVTSVNQSMVEHKQTGGNNKNIFKSSDTSSAKHNESLNYSKTSSVIYNDRTDNFSDTSVIGQIGGELDISDTLRSISELKERKSKSSNKNSSSTSTFKSNLDMGIFKKSQNQSGGSKSNVDLKKKMLEAGINSSSTSSICE